MVYNSFPNPNHCCCCNQEIPPYVPLHSFHLLQSLPYSHLSTFLNLSFPACFFFSMRSLFHSIPTCNLSSATVGNSLATTAPWWSLLRNPLSGSTLLARLATLQPTCINMYPSFSIDSCCGETGAVTKHLLETISVRIIWFCWRPCKAETAELQVAASAGNAWPAHHLQCTCRATTYHIIP